MIIGNAISVCDLRKKSSGGGNDADAQAFITATGISGTNATAINTLVVTLKSINVWTKIKAAYPMVGGTSTTCKFNLKNPVDSNAAYRLTFFGGGTFSANGYQPGGVNGYANTFLSSSIMALNSGHLSYYSRTNSVSAATRFDMGSLQASPTSFSDLTSSYTNLTIFRFNNGSPFDSIATTNSLGFYTGSRTASTIIKTYKNGSVILNGIANSSSVSNTPFYIGASNDNGTANFFSDKQCAFASIGDGLTDAEALAFYNAVQTFNTTLNRNV